MTVLVWNGWHLCTSSPAACTARTATLQAHLTAVVCTTTPTPKLLHSDQLHLFSAVRAARRLPPSAAALSCSLVSCGKGGPGVVRFRRPHHGWPQAQARFDGRAYACPQHRQALECCSMEKRALKVLQRASHTCLQTHARCCRHVGRHALGCSFKFGWRVDQFVYQAQLQTRGDRYSGLYLACLKLSSAGESTSSFTRPSCNRGMKGQQVHCMCEPAMRLKFTWRVDS